MTQTLKPLREKLPDAVLQEHQAFVNNVFRKLGLPSPTWKKHIFQVTGGRDKLYRIKGLINSRGRELLLKCGGKFGAITRTRLAAEGIKFANA